MHLQGHLLWFEKKTSSSIAIPRYLVAPSPVQSGNLRVLTHRELGPISTGFGPLGPREIVFPITPP